MHSGAIWLRYSGSVCEACNGGRKPTFQGFCKFCYAELPQKLRAALHQPYGDKFEQAYMGCLSWFRTHPFQGVHRAKQKGLFEEE